MNKYRAVSTYVDGIRFDSKAEARRYCELKTLEMAGIIESLELQPRFNIDVNGIRIGFYKADFRYIENGKPVTEDVKGVRTPVYKLKKKLVEALYPGTKIVEVS